ncbi:MAG: inositol monophosphatase family protein [Gammaproteobacteria bacterium]
MDHPWTEQLIELHRLVRLAVINSTREDTGDINAKGDVVKVFDRVANDAALKYLQTSAVPLLVESEESESQTMGTGTPAHHLILDPVDGSDNWSRRLPLSALSCAVLPIDAPLKPESVIASIVGPFDQEVPLVAQQRSGAWSDMIRLQTSDVHCLTDAVISIELNHYAPALNLARMMADARGIRCYGSAACAITLVASGKTDAHIDIRARLTPESYLAASHLLLEAGGCITGLDGAPLPAASGLTDGISLIAAANQALCDEIVERLGNVES